MKVIFVPFTNTPLHHSSSVTHQLMDRTTRSW